MSSHALRRAICISLLFLSLVPFHAKAQQLATASIRGSVADPSGKSIGSAIVTLTSVRQGTVRTFTTQSDGQFSFTTLEAANYIV